MWISPEIGTHNRVVMVKYFAIQSDRQAAKSDSVAFKKSDMISFEKGTIQNKS